MVRSLNLWKAEATGVQLKLWNPFAVLWEEVEQGEEEPTEEVRPAFEEDPTKEISIALERLAQDGLIGRG